MKFTKKLFFGTITCFAIVFISVTAFSQKPQKLVKKGQEYFFRQDFKSSLEYFQQALDAAPNNAEALLYTGSTMQFLGMEDKGLEYIKSISVEDGKLVKNFFYWKAFALYRNSFFDDASKNIRLQISSKNNTLKEASIKLEKSIKQAQKLNIISGDTYIENLGQTINTIAPEYSAVLTSDHRTINFTTKRKENKGGKDKTGFREDILVSTLDENDQWSEPHQLEKLTTIKNDASVQLFGDDDEMLIYQEGDLFITKKTNGKWSNMRPISDKINTLTTRESHAFITKQGDKMIYCSDKGTKNGDLDLFISFRGEDGAWKIGTPIENLNTTFDEDAPFVAEDGTLYFSSKGHNSMGGFDIFKAEYNPLTKKYSAPVNMGMPINSVGEDIFFNLKNKIAYFTSDRPGGFGATDIYRAYLFRNVMLSGIVYKGEDKTPLSEVELTFVSESNKKYSLKTDANGAYQISIPFFETYNATLFYQGQEQLKESFKPRILLRNPEISKKDFYIEAIKELEVVEAPKSVETTEKIEGIVLDKKTGDPLAANIKVIDLKDGNIIKELSLGRDGKLTYPVDISATNLTFQAHHGGYFSGEYEWKKGSVNSFTIKLAPASKGKRLYTYRIFFDFNKASIKDESRTELLKMVEFFKANPNKLVEIGGHTDNVGSADYNQSLSQRRAESIKQFLITKGINGQNITTVGYGESRPLVSNDDEKSGRELNRRIEFKIL